MQLLLNAAEFAHDATIRSEMRLFVESERQIDAPDDPRVSPDDTEPGKGSIVNISAIAADFVSRGIRCNCICSGNVDARTRRDRQPSWTSAVYLPSTDGRLGSAEEIAALAGLASKRNPDAASTWTGSSTNDARSHLCTIFDRASEREID